MKNQSNQESKTCFVVMKFGRKGTDEFEQQKSLYEDIVKPAVEEAGLGYTCIRVDDIMRPTSIIKDIVKYLWSSDIVIADLTGQNPNVFYELGVRHALKGRTVMLVQSIDDVPLDVRSYRVIEYSPNNAAGFRRVIKEIRRHLEELSKDPSAMDSPVIDSLPVGAKPFEEALSQSPQASLVRDLRIVKNSVEGLSRRFDTEVASRLDSVSAVADLQKLTMDNLNQFASQLRPNLLSELAMQVDKITHRIEDVARSEVLSHIVERFGLVGVHRTRLDAIEQEFYQIMETETKQIDIVGSTIFGLRGNSWVTTQRILDLLRSKRIADDKFVVRILLTHYEFLSTRMAQERLVKTPDRYVISKESVVAIEELRKRELLDCVRFYKGAPTCFSIVCHEHKQMLLNPYPYEKEAYTTWTVVFREVPSGIYQDFLIAHVENPWENSLLKEKFSEDYEKRLKEKADADFEEYYRESRKTK
jgi:hypothetical protein